MALIFISYTHKDKELATKVQNSLQIRGHHVWRDDTVLKTGTQIPEGVASGIAISDYFITLLSQNALGSSWMRGELNLYANDPKRWEKILALKSDETTPVNFSPLLTSTKYADISGENFNKGIEEILNSIGEPTDESAVKLHDLGRLRFAIDLAARAGNVAMRFYNSSLRQNEALDDRKNAATRADKAAQNEIVSRLAGHEEYSNEVLISEEKPYNDETSVSPDGYTWVVDPLDGTGNFDNKIPFFCTAVGVLKNGKPYIGVVFDPVSNDIYYAMNGMPTEVWNVSRGEVAQVLCDPHSKTLKESVVGIHLSSRPEVAERLLKENLLLDVGKEVKSLRAFGSGQLALAFLSTGKLQAFFQLDNYIWDQVAGVVLIQNAGGVVWDLKRNKSWVSQTKDILASANNDICEGFTKFWSER